MTEITEHNLNYYAAPARLLTAQERQFCVFFGRGYDPRRAAEQAGFGPEAYQRLLQKPEIQATMAMLRARITEYMGVEVTKELLTSMLFEAHSTAETGMTKIAAIKEIAKINGLYEDPKITVNLTNVNRVEDLASLSDEELARIAQMAHSERALIQEQRRLATPTPVSQAKQDKTIVDGQFEEVT